MSSRRREQHPVDFAIALGQFMYVLPAKVKRGIAEVKGVSGV